MNRKEDLSVTVINNIYKCQEEEVEEEDLVDSEVEVEEALEAEAAASVVEVVALAEAEVLLVEEAASEVVDLEEVGSEVVVSGVEAPLDIQAASVAHQVSAEVGAMGVMVLAYTICNKRE